MPNSTHIHTHNITNTLTERQRPLQSSHSIENAPYNVCGTLRELTINVFHDSMVFSDTDTILMTYQKTDI